MYIYVYEESHNPVMFQTTKQINGDQMTSLPSRGYPLKNVNQGTQ